ncbi:unnamed protein product, partial [Ascophyllum nodosum]
GQLNRENEYFPVSLFAPEKLVSRERGSAVPSHVHPAHSPHSGVLPRGIPPAFRGSIHLLVIPPTAIGSAPSLSDNPCETTTCSRIGKPSPKE